ncbi:hypothetical protein NBRC13296_21965 [Paenibacillus chitinolyticus]|uniref:hypothetical protein n=1 Tax=Paenibacillus chitinolyticus TaxID=79263 RepID=UPI003556963A
MNLLGSASIIVSIINYRNNRKLEAFKNENNKELELFKQEIAILTEKNKALNQKLMHDFSLYRTKKHEIYPEVYKNVATSLHKLKIIHNDWERPNVVHLSAEDALRSLINLGYIDSEDKKMISSINNQWENDESKSDLINEVCVRKKFIEILNFGHELKESYFYFCSVELFLSEHIVTKLYEIFGARHRYLDLIQQIIPSRYNDFDTNEIYSAIEEELSRYFKEIIVETSRLKGLIREELSIADYMEEISVTN